MAIDDKPGLWVYTFDLLVENRKSLLSDEEENEIIAKLERRLEKLSYLKKDTENKVDPWAAEEAAKRLAIYYRKKGKLEDVRRVLLQVGVAFDNTIDRKSALQVAGWLEHLYRLYTSFNLKEDADKLLVRIREVGTNVIEEMGTFSASFDIPKDKLEEYLDEMISETSDDILTRFTHEYIPSKENAIEQLKNSSKNAPLQNMLTVNLQDNRGRTIATVGPIDNDMEGRIILQISQSLNITAILLRKTIEKALKNGIISFDSIVDYIN